ncbi:MAG: hypothetical protein HYX27_01190 [Acidobacteria bacterium]|nr:hypothetical protein [Acidobacteriota bacterium]
MLDLMDADVQALIASIENSFRVKFAEGELTDDSSLDDVSGAVRLRVDNKAL